MRNLSLTYLNALHNIEGETWHRSLKKKGKKERKREKTREKLNYQFNSTTEREEEKRGEGMCVSVTQSSLPVGLEISRIDELDYTLYRAGLKCGPTNKLHARLIPMTM